MVKTVFIANASTKVGRVTIKLFCTSGWNVIALMQNPEREAELTRLDNVLVIGFNSDIIAIRIAILSGIQYFKQIDVVINIPSDGHYGIFESISIEEIRRQFENEVFGVMNVIRSILPYFRKQGKGLIINVSSAGGRMAVPQASLYVASKFALEGFSESLSYELASQNIILKIVESECVDSVFIQKAADMLARNCALMPYEDYLEKSAKVSDFLVEGIVSIDYVAEMIFKAATDGANILRYRSCNDSKS